MMNTVKNISISNSTINVCERKYSRAFYVSVDQDTYEKFMACVEEEERANKTIFRKMVDDYYAKTFPELVEE